MAERKITAKDLTEGVKGITEEQMTGRFEEFLKKVEADDYKIVPTISAFADFMDQSRAEVHRWFTVHTSASKQMREMCADTIAGGAMLKKYDTRITNFALKNWCGWEEAPQKKGQTSKEVSNEKHATEALDAYIAEKRRKQYKVV